MQDTTTPNSTRRHDQLAKGCLTTLANALALPSVNGDFSRAVAHCARTSGTPLAQVRDDVADWLDRAQLFTDDDLTPRQRDHRDTVFAALHAPFRP